MPLAATRCRTSSSTTARCWRSPTSARSSRPGEARGVEARLLAAERWVHAADGDEGRAAAEAAGMIVRHTEVIDHLPERDRPAPGGARADATATSPRRSPRPARRSRLPATTSRSSAAPPPESSPWPTGRTATSTPPTPPGRMPSPTSSVPGTTPTCSAGILAMADIRTAQGRLADARRILERGLRLGVRERAAAPRDGRHARGARASCTSSGTTSRRPRPAPRRRRGARRGAGPAAEPVPRCGSRRPGSARRKATSTRRSRSSTTRSAPTSRTSSPRSGPSRPSARGFWCARDGTRTR